jgi:predicted metal-binding protein
MMRTVYQQIVEAMKDIKTFVCTECHHEWQGVTEKETSTCDWCGAKGKESK